LNAVDALKQPSSLSLQIASRPCVKHHNPFRFDIEQSFVCSRPS